MFEVCSDYECLDEHHCMSSGMFFNHFHQCRVMLHVVPSKGIYICTQVYSLFYVDMDFHSTLYVFGLFLRVAHSSEVGWMKVYPLYQASKGHPQCVGAYEALCLDFLLDSVL